MTKKIRKAVFPVAGMGTRFLPATKSMPKELLPIVDKPLIQLAVEEAVQAGLDTLIFITGRHKRAIEDHFDSNNELEAVLRAKGKTEQLSIVQQILPSHVQCIFLRQSEPLGLGHAVLQAERVVGDEAFAVLLADDYITDQEPNMTRELIDAFSTTDKPCLAVKGVNPHETSNYGIIKAEKNQSDIIEIIEKPICGEAPSNLAAIGRYVLTPEIFEILKNQLPGVAAEIQLTDAINKQARIGNFGFRELRGKHFDCGSIAGYLRAIEYEAKKYIK